MMKCLAIINQKGGVGKSTTAAAIGEALQRMKHKVLYIDLDPQGNLSRAGANGLRYYDEGTKHSQSHNRDRPG